MMKRQGLVITAWGLSDDRGLEFGFDDLPLVGVVFFPSSSLMGVVLFPSYAHCVVLRFFFFPLFFSLSLSLSLSLSPSLSLSLSCGFCLDRVLLDVKNGLANCNF